MVKTNGIAREAQTPRRTISRRDTGEMPAGFSTRPSRR
jgi:hypothetical protein